MTGSEIISAILTVLRDHMNHAHLDGFSANARLNEDLYLDSVLVLEIFLNLELEFGLSAPDEVLNRQDISTVADLAALFVPAEAAPVVEERMSEAAGAGVHGEDYIDIKVHCFVSCVCDGLKRQGIDHRPYYFGVWDADFAVNDRFELLYHAPTVDHEFFRQWYRQLYGVSLREWYDPAKTKADNVAVMLDLLEKKSETGCLMVMLDMFHLPERENKFNQNPFPHYLMLEKTADPDVWFVLDPDYRWEGEIEKAKVLHAISQPTVAGGYIFDRAEAHAPTARDLRAYFEACFIPGSNPLISAVRRIVSAHLEGLNGVKLGDLACAVRELPVITIRKYAYEHGFAFFWRALKLPNEGFDHWCDEIEALFQELKALQYALMKLAQTGDRSIAPAIHERLDRLDDREFGIKAKLAEVFGDWCAQNSLMDAPPRLAGGAAR